MSQLLHPFILFSCVPFFSFVLTALFLFANLVYVSCSVEYVDKSESNSLLCHIFFPSLMEY